MDRSSGEWAAGGAAGKAGNCCITGAGSEEAEDDVVAGVGTGTVTETMGD